VREVLRSARSARGPTVHVQTNVVPRSAWVAFSTGHSPRTCHIREREALAADALARWGELERPLKRADEESTAPQPTIPDGFGH